MKYTSQFNVNLSSRLTNMIRERCVLLGISTSQATAKALRTWLKRMKHTEPRMKRITLRVPRGLSKNILNQLIQKKMKKDLKGLRPDKAANGSKEPEKVVA